MKRRAVVLYNALTFVVLVMAGGTYLSIAPLEMAEFNVPSEDGELLLTFRCLVLASTDKSAANARAAGAFFEAKLLDVTNVWAADMNAGLGSANRASPNVAKLKVANSDGEANLRALSDQTYRQFGCRYAGSGLNKAPYAGLRPLHQATPSGTSS